MDQLESLRVLVHWSILMIATQLASGANAKGFSPLPKKTLISTLIHSFFSFSASVSKSVLAWSAGCKVGPYFRARLFPISSSPGTRLLARSLDHPQLQAPNICHQCKPFQFCSTEWSIRLGRRFCFTVMNSYSNRTALQLWHLIFSSSSVKM